MQEATVTSANNFRPQLVVIKLRKNMLIPTSQIGKE